MNTAAKTVLTLAAAALATAAVAQDAGAPPTTPPTTAPQAAPATPVSDPELKQFATALIAIEEIHSDATTPDADKQKAMVAKVRESGLEPKRFNEIAQASEADEGVKQRLRTELVAQQTPAPGR